MSLEEQLQKRALLKECERTLTDALNYNGMALQRSLVEVLSTENLRRSALKFERQRVLNELREVVGEIGDDQAVNFFDGAIASLERRDSGY